MSNYFTRLAARTGLHAPKAARAPAADIAEQSVEIEAAHPAPLIARSAAPQTAAPRAAQRAPSGRAANEAAGAAVAPRRPPVEGIHSEPQPQRRAENRVAAQAPAPPPGTEEEVTRGNVTGMTDEPQGTEPAPARHEENTARVAPKISPTPLGTMEAPRPSHARAQAIPQRSAPPPEKFFEPASVPRAAAENRFVAPGRAPEDSALAARSQPMPPRAANEVAVHIGAIKVEIHPPPPAAAPAPAPRVENIPERPRFEPRRHYLRW